MSLSIATMNELRRELSRLRHARKSIDIRIAAVESLLRVDAKAPPRLLGTPTARLSGNHSGAGKRKPNGRTFGRRIANLIGATRPMRASEIIEALRKTGVTVGGRTPLGDRVHRSCAAF